MVNQIILSSLTLEELTESFRKVVREEISTALKTFAEESKKEEKLLSKKAAMKFLGATYPTMTKWTNLGLVKGHIIGGLTKYKQSDLDTALIEIETIKNKGK